MAEFLKGAVLVFISFSSGVVIASAVFAFIAIIGIVPSMAVKTNTTKYVVLYEEMIIFGGIFGCLNTIANYNLNLGAYFFGNFLVVVYFLGVGVFVGCLASSLAECLDVIPVFSKRANIKKGIFLILIAIAVGKFIGSMIYFLFNSFQV